MKIFFTILYNKYTATVFMLCSFCILFLSCSGADPILYQVNTQLQVYWEYPFEHYERLLVQVLADDDDGYEEIYEIYIIHDETEQYWRVTKDDWGTIEKDGNEWIVLTEVVSTNNKNLPRGEYRIVILDLSGYRDEQTIFIKQETKEHERRYLPLLSLQSQNVYIPTLLSVNDTPNNPLIIELAYPTPLNDFVGNIDTTELDGAVALLGDDGRFYEVVPGKPIKFVLNGKSRANIFIHHVGNDDILYTTGPFEMQFTDF